MHRPIDTPVGEKPGWRSFVTEDGRKSLSEVNATISIPPTGSWLRRLLAFSGPGYMVSVGYMDPGNWATDLAGGSKFGYALLCVIMLSNLMAISGSFLSLMSSAIFSISRDFCTSHGISVTTT